MEVFFDWSWCLIKKYGDIWDKVSDGIKNEFDSKSICNKRFLKNRVKSYRDEDTDFRDKEVSKVDSYYTCFTEILIDFVLKKDENYYLPVFWKECKNI